MPEIIFRYFQSLTYLQKEQISRLKPLYDEWNSKINVISRRDMDNFYVHHVLHSLSIARKFSFSAGTTILDVGTGGGFPGIPLAILYPDSQFTLLDSIAKKIRVAGNVCEELKLSNVRLVNRRVEEEKAKYDFIVSRAVTEFEKFVKLTLKNLDRSGNNDPDNGIIYLKGGDFEKELGTYRNSVKISEIKDFFAEPYFETKKIIFLPSSMI